MDDRTSILVPPKEAAPSAGPVSPVSSVGISLFLVVAMILALAWAMRRMRLPGGNSGSIKVQASLYLGARERVVLIDAAGKHVLLSVAPGQIRHLHSYDQAPDLEPKDPDGREMGVSFQDRLRESLGLSARK